MSTKGELLDGPLRGGGKKKLRKHVGMVAALASTLPGALLVPLAAVQSPLPL